MANDKAILEDIGFNADLYIANQEGNTQNWTSRYEMVVAMHIYGYSQNGQ